MRSTLKLLFISLLGMSLSFCSSAPKEDNSSDALPQYDDYQPVGTTYGETNESPRATTSNPYGDDDYDYSSEDGTPIANVYTSDSADDSYDSSDNINSDPLPVEKLSAPKSSTLQAALFKDGMYNISSNCNMRSGPSRTASKEGLIPKGKRLWVEGHNDTWVKVFKKSGPVFIHKSCL